jgi:DNA polymerase III delta subunit
MYKNIIHITGNDSYGISLEVSRWVRAFEGKYGSVNIDRYRLEERSVFPSLRDQLLTTGLFAEKRIFVFSGGIEKKSKSAWLEEILEKYKDAIPEDHFLLFHSLSSKEDGLSTWLRKHSDTRAINTLWDPTTWWARYSELSDRAVRSVLGLYERSESVREEWEKSPNLGHSIRNSLEIISLLDSGGQRIDEKDIAEIVGRDIGGKVFDLVDAITSVRPRLAIEHLRSILRTMKPLELLPSLIGLVRSAIYVKYLEGQNIRGDRIGMVVKIHPFVVKKTLASSISYEKLYIFYEKLIRASISYKSGKGLSDIELWPIFAIELAILGLKK